MSYWAISIHRTESLGQALKVATSAAHISEATFVAVCEEPSVIQALVSAANAVELASNRGAAMVFDRTYEEPNTGTEPRE